MTIHDAAYIAGGFAALWLLTVHLFIALVHAKVLHERATLTLFWRAHLYPGLVLFVVLDVLANLIVGTIIYLELPLWVTDAPKVIVDFLRFKLTRPREFLLTTRTQRHFYGRRDTWRWHVAAFWARQLNQIDPGHV